MFDLFSHTIPSTLPEVQAAMRSSLSALSEKRTSLQGALAEVINDRRNARTKLKQKRFLEVALENATTYDEWAHSALALDELEGRTAWKEDSVSTAYNYRLLDQRLAQLRDARLAGDLKRVLFLLRTSLNRNFAHAGNPELYAHTSIGTKNLVEDWVAEVEEALQFILRVESPLVSESQKLDELTCLRQAYGRTALLLSGGGTLGMNHVGVLAALREKNLLPRIISGTSAGSIVAGVCCTRTDEELPQLLNDFIHGDLNVFQDSQNPESIYDHIARLLKIGVWADISYLKGVMRSLLGDLTFQEAYNRTRRILNITVSSASMYELPRLLNYLTAPNVLIWSAIAASCSVPFIFSASEIMAKDPRTGQAQPWNASPQRWIDGSVDNDLPMAKLSELFNVNHFIVSQVNPHIVPFLEKSSDKMPRPAESAEAHNQSFHGPTSFRDKVVDLAVGEIMHRMHMLSELGVFPVLCTKVRSMLSQKYSGDITIVPDISYSDYPVLMSNPTPEFLVEARLRGERATWPKLSIIHNHCAIELAIDNALYELNVKRVFGTGSGLHHLRHRSHEPKGNQPIWDRNQSYNPKTAQQKQLTIHPSLSLEITPLDVDTPNASPVRRRPFLSLVIGAHRSTPTTPSEESRYRQHLREGLNAPPLLEWRDSSSTTVELPVCNDEGIGVPDPDDDSSEMLLDRTAPVTPPSTPSFLSPSLGSQGLSYAGKIVNDASGTRRMMLRRKNSSLRRSSSSVNGENGSKV